MKCIRDAFFDIYILILIDYTIEYFILRDRFGHLACFASDVEEFLQVLDSNKKSEFLRNIVKENEATTIVPAKALGQSITVFKVQNLIGNLIALPVDGMPDAISFNKFICPAVSFILY